MVLFVVDAPVYPSAMRRFLLCIATTVLPGSASMLCAQSVNVQGATAASTMVHSARPVATATPTTAAIRIDGHLTEDAWRSATPLTEFVQVEPNAGQRAGERTEVRILTSPNALIIGARLYDSHAAELQPRLVRRDDGTVADRLAITLDPYHNHRTAVRFTVTAAGAIADATVGAQHGADPSWDAVWEAATAVDDSGWTAELRIPLSQLRYAVGADVWGIQIERFVLRTQERDAFAYVPPNERGVVEHFGHLRGVDQFAASRYLEALPYVSERASLLSPGSTSPLSPSRQSRFQAGADLRYAVSSSLTLNATVNPDFGQVEVDPAVVNLTAFETTFPEKRPFFVGGNEFFDFGRTRAYNGLAFPQVFFTRRIGRAPQLLPPNAATAVAVTVPDQSDIAVATKLTGRSASGWSLGALHALTREARGRALFANGTTATGIAEPRTNVVVARGTRDFADGQTTLGVLATSLDRALDDSSALFLRSSARVAGVDLRHAWGNRGWALDGDFSVSSVRGTPSAIALTQRSSAHYFQRPDRSDSHFDATRTSLSGYAGEIAVAKLRGAWVGSLNYQDVSPGFEVNDLGVARNAGRHMFSTDVHYQSYTPGRIFNNFLIWPFTNHQWNYDGQPLKNVGFPTYNFWLQGQFRNFWNGVIWTGYTPRFVDDQLTRGGPVGLSPLSRLAHVELRTSERGSVAASVTVDAEWSELSGRRRTISAGASWRPASNVHLRIDPSYSAERDPVQFVQRIGSSSSLVAPVGGALFAQIERRTLSLDTRADWTFTPRLTFQLYLQPLVDAGAYEAFKQLRVPRTLDYQVFGRDVGTVVRPGDGTLTIDPDGAGPVAPLRLADPNYTVRALRGNAVLRWEYRPGSTVYVVWQQQRNEDAKFGDLRWRRDLGDVAHLPADNVFLVKASFWLGF